VGEFRRAALCGDTFGLPQLLRLLPPGRAVCLVGAAVRPDSHPALAALAREAGLPFLVQPRRGDPGHPGFLGALAELSPDLILVNSYAQLIPPEVLAISGGNGANIHWSLLPRNRGPNPVQWAIIRGEEETGVSLHHLDWEVDAGDLIAQQRVPILPSDTWLTLHARLSAASEELLAAALPELVAGRSPRRPQDRRAATVNARLGPDSPRIHWEAMTDRQVHDLIRAQVAPLAGAFCETPGGRIRFTGYVPLDAIPALRRGEGVP
jgi:UDP-4-amino-4-deoxy-L-arabinose formyltransferase/UDP-glucuronic acid dehydrogenase (UDP-4-keto-hexauronic acid decarboxylating)